MALCLRVRFRSPDGAVHGERVTYQLPVRLGRNAMNDCQLPHPFVSEFHCLIDLVNGQLCVRDLNSKNGIYGQNLQRFPAGQPVPLASFGNRFVVGAAIEVTVETFEQQVDVGQRSSSFHGSVLGNRAVLQQTPPGAPGWQGGVPSLPPLSIAGSPPAGGPMPGTPLPGTPLPGPAYPGPSMPGGPLRGPSMPGGPLPGPSMPHGFSPGPMPYGPPGGNAPSSMAQSLPGLPPVPGAGGPYGPPPARPSAHPPVPPAAPGGAFKSTQHFSMGTEVLALAGLRELAASLVPGVPLETTGDIARLLTKLHDLVEVFCRCFVVLRDGYAQFVSSTGLAEPASRRLNRSESALRVEAARDPSTLAAALLDWRNHDFDPPQVVEGALVDILMHHAALVEGVLRGVNSMLEELSPAAVEQAVDAGGGVGAVLGRHKALWRAYEERFQAVADETRRFEAVFGSEFAASYREYRARQSRSIPP